VDGALVATGEIGSGGEVAWRAAEPVALPFDGVAPTFERGADDTVHAFWIDAERDTLLYSRVDGADFPSGSDWTDPRILGEGVALEAAAVDPAGGLHVAFIQSPGTESLPAGIYYRGSVDGGTNWTVPILLYPSAYLRTTPATQLNLSVAAGAGDQVLVTWDVPALDRVFLSRSADRGRTWGAPTVIDARTPDDSPNAVGPSEIAAFASGLETHLIWQAGHGFEECQQYHQYSADGGETWGAPQPMLEELGGCPEANRFLAGPDDLTLLFTATESQRYLLAWSGREWSEPQPQRTLSGFTNPDTFRQANLVGLSAATLGDRLLVAGVDAGASGDVWFTSRPLGDTTAWFPPPPIWSEPVTVWDTASTAVNVIAADPAIVTDADGLAHAFWMGEDDGDRFVTYARWDGVSWSRPTAILNSRGPVENLAVVVSPNNRIVAVWDDGTGQILFSQASPARAGSTTDWAEPLPLPVPRIAAAQPALAVDRSGTIVVAYAVPVNEDRGVYLVQSTDAGVTWTSAIPAFDGVAAGWERVGAPALAVDDAGIAYLLWTRGSFEGQAQSVHYGSVDMIDEIAVEPEDEVSESGAGWLRVAVDGSGAVHRLWQEGSGTVWHQVSLDGGVSWTRAERAGTAVGPAAMAQDPAGQPYFAQAADGALTLRRWQDGRWSSVEGLDSGLQATPNGLGMEVTGGGRLVALSLAVGEGVLAVDRPVELPDFVLAPLPTPMPTPAPAATATPEPTPEPTPTIVFVTQTEQPAGILPFALPSDPTVRIAISLLPVGLFVVVILVYGIRRRRN
jgi:hypothetical protein